MTDKQKIELMKKLLEDFWETGGNFEAREGTLLATFDTILRFEDGTDE